MPVAGPPVIVEVSMALQSFTAIRESEMVSLTVGVIKYF